MKKAFSQHFRRVLIVYKKSSYQEHVLDEQDANYLRLLRERSIVTRKSKSSHDTHLDTLDSIQRHLRNLRIDHDVCLRTQLKPIRNYGLVLTIGGDGTFLETSHYLKSGLLLGINSVPRESVGYYCKATSENFLDKLYELINGQARIQTLHRLKVTVDGKAFWPLALNDVLFANTNPAGTTRYVLTVQGRKEEQKSSGLWISPAPGSTAATKSAGGRALPLDSTDIQYVVREPYAPPRGKAYRLLKGVLPSRKSVEILSMMDDAALFIDGPHIVYMLRRASKIVIKNAMEPIQAIW